MTLAEVAKRLRSESRSGVDDAIVRYVLEQLEADPEFKAAHEAIEIVKEVGAHVDLWFEDDHHVHPDRIKALIDSLPPEGK